MLKRLEETIRWRTFVTPLVVLAVMAAGLGGCSGYTMKGKVVAGDISYAAIVDADDPRLEGPGIASAMISLETDPDKLSREPVGDAVSDTAGNFSISVRRPGAGILIYDVGMQVRRKGYEGVSQTFRLPPQGKRILITLRGGPDTLPPEEETPYEQYEKFK